MSGLKRLIHRTWSTTPAIFSTRLFPPANNLRRLTSTRFFDVSQGRSDDVKRSNFDDVSEFRRYSSKPLLLYNGWRSIHAASSPSMRKSSIWSSKVAEFCTSTTSNSTDSCPEKSNPETKFPETKNGGNGGVVGEEEDSISFAEAKRLMRLVNVEALKMKLGMEGKEVIGYTELLEACESMGVARTLNEATAFARVLDEAGVILLFRDKVYLHPDKVVDLVRRAVPLALTSENDPRRGELKTLEERKEEIDVLAHKQVRRILWSGLGLAVLQVGLFFRLTFWEFSWDVMEPIAFFTTTTGIVIGYAYFLFTRRDPTYQDLMKRLFLSRQRKLFKTQKFDVDRLIELQKNCKSPLDLGPSIKNQARVDVEALHNR